MDQLPARIGHQRRARIGDERKAATLHKTRDQARTALGPIMVMVGAQFCVNAVCIKELASNPCILGKDLIYGAKRVERTQGDIAKVADRCGHNVQAGLKARDSVLRRPGPGISLAGSAVARSRRRKTG